MDEASDYVEQLEIIRKIRDSVTMKDDISLPQICVIGDQSSGKSSFLSRLTGVKFPVDAKMCTKAAVVVTCNRDETLQNDMIEIEEWNNPGSYVPVTSTDKAIKEAEEMLLQGESNRRKCLNENKILVDKSIKLKVTGPNVIDIIIVDLPGIQHSGPTKDSIIKLIETNIKKPETLNLLVSEAKQDVELTKAIELAEKYDPDHERTLRVLSKFDNFDSSDTRARAIDLVKAGVQEPFDALSQSLGPHAVISVGKDGNLRGEKDGEAAEQKELGLGFGLPECRAGIATLKGRLPPIFANLIKSNFPYLKEIVHTRLYKAQGRLEKLGKQPLSPMEILFKVHHALRTNMDIFQLDITSEAFLPMKDEINKVKNNITFEFVTSDFKLNSFECMLFQGSEEFKRVIEKIHDFWEPVVIDYIMNVKQVAYQSISIIQNDPDISIYPLLISTIQAEYKKNSWQNIIPKFQEACKECLHQEKFFGTSNHYFNAKMHENEAFPQQLVDYFTLSLRELLKKSKNPSDRSYDTSSYRINESQIINCLNEAKQKLDTKNVHLSIWEKQKNRLFAAVEAHFDVEKKTFVDNLLKKTKDIVIKGHCDWIERELLRSKKIIDYSNEDESVKKLREELLGQVERLENIMLLLKDVPFPSENNDPSDKIDKSSDVSDNSSEG